MGFLSNLTAFLPGGRKAQPPEYFFALNIAAETLQAALWLIENGSLKVLQTASETYSSNEEIASVTDKLLDAVVGLKEIEPQKILFGVPNSWLIDENLKDEYLKLLRGLVKELELTPMAYVATAHALINFLEKKEGVPTTAILVGFEKIHLAVTVVRAGKLDGVKVVSRGESAGADIEKALLTFTDVETLPSKILIYGSSASELKSQLLSFSWMSKLSFLHIPKIEALEDDLDIKSVCLAGGSEIYPDIKYTQQNVKQATVRDSLMPEESEEKESNEPEKTEPQEDHPTETESEGDNFGFVEGDVGDQMKSDKTDDDEKELTITEDEVAEPSFDQQEAPKKKLNPAKLLPKRFLRGLLFYGGGLLVLFVILLGIYVYFAKADVKIYVEPKIIEKDATVTADPNQKQVNEEAKIIPGQVVSVEISGSGKDSASGKKQIGDPAKGTIIIYNKTSDSVSFSKGSSISGKNGLKFILDSTVNIASSSATDAGITFGKATAQVTATVIGADSNLPSGSEFTIGNHSADKVTGKAEGNFSGGNSKDVTVVSSEDQQKLLAKVSSDLRGQAQQKLQEKYPAKKILQEALSENITKKTYNKNVNDQASDFSLNLTVNYKGTAFDDSDLRTIVSKLVDTQVPEGFQLDISGTETQADVSKLEKDGRLIFLAKFKAKMLPKIDTDKVRSQIKFKTVKEAENIIKSTDNVLGSEIKISPNLPGPLQRLPILGKNITIQTGLK